MQNLTIEEKKFMLAVDGIEMPAALTFPTGKASGVAVLLIPGSLFLDVDGNFPLWNVRPNTYADLARQLAERGHVVLRYAKTGPGTGSVVTDPEKAKVYQTSFSQRIVVAKAALAKLEEETGAKLPLVAAGHSEGLLVAALLANEPGVKLAGVVSLSGPAYHFFDLMYQQAPARQRGDEEAKRQQLLDFKRMIETVRNGQKVTPDLLSSALTAGYTQIDENGWKYLRSMDAVDPALALSKVDCPVLLVQGSSDDSVFEDNVEVLKAARGEKPTEVAFFPGLQHFYKKVTPGLSPQEVFGLTTETDPAVAGAIDQWVRQQFCA